MKKNIVDLSKVTQLFNQGYSLSLEIFNTYQVRIRHEDHPNKFFDWYHTTGSLVLNDNGSCSSMGKVLDPEKVAQIIKTKLKL